MITRMIAKIRAMFARPAAYVLFLPDDVLIQEF